MDENGAAIPRAPWPQLVGGVLLGYFVPLVISVFALRRWKNVSRGLLKWSLVISSVCFASLLLFFAMLAVLPAGSPTLHLFMALLQSTYGVSWTLLAISYRRHHCSKPSWLLKAGFTFLVLVWILNMVIRVYYFKAGEAFY
jgi:hypothetical protein